MRKALIGLVALASIVGVATAEADAPTPDKSAYTVFHPTPDNLLRSLCTDRPTKSTAPCTVDAGHWQIESDVYNYTRQSGGGVSQTTQLFTNPTLKLGLANTLDVEFNIVPYETVTTHVASGATTTAAGVGDLFVRAKWNLIGDDGGAFAFALAPYVKAPTAAAGVGDGAVEGGILAPLQFNLPMNWQLVVDPEMDLLANAMGPGRHLNAAGLLSFSYPLTKSITGSLEVWGDSNFDPKGTVTQSSFDLGAAWIPPKSPNFQLDGGVNLGLNRATPAAQVYLGVSQRF